MHTGEVTGGSGLAPREIHILMIAVMTGMFLAAIDAQVRQRRATQGRAVDPEPLQRHALEVRALQVRALQVRPLQVRAGLLLGGGLFIDDLTGIRSRTDDRETNGRDTSETWAHHRTHSAAGTSEYAR